MLRVYAGRDCYCDCFSSVIRHRGGDSVRTGVQIHLVVAGRRVAGSGCAIVGCDGGFQSKAVVVIGHITVQHAHRGQGKVLGSQGACNYNYTCDFGINIHRVRCRYGVNAVGDRHGVVTGNVGVLRPRAASITSGSYGHVFNGVGCGRVGDGSVEIALSRTEGQDHIHSRFGINCAHAPIVIGAGSVVAAAVGAILACEGHGRLMDNINRTVHIALESGASAPHQTDERRGVGTSHAGTAPGTITVARQR